MKNNQKVLVTGLRLPEQEFPELIKLILDTAKGVKFPAMAQHSNSFGDDGNPILILSNGELISSRYLQIAD